MSIYVENVIHGSMEELWLKTQTPELHKRWDVRFTDIEYLPRGDDPEPQRFLYQTRIGFGVAICGEGEAVGSRSDADGSRTSALRFWSRDAKSLIQEGAGYWKYLPIDDGIRFFTSYDYRVRWGAIGRAFDLLVFRPLIGWATAWSFDRLRLWIEKQIDPAVSLRFSVLHLLSTLVVSFVWIYQGAVPKLIFQHPDELAMLVDAGIPSAWSPKILQLLGWAEVALGILVIAFAKMRWPFLLTIALMVLAMGSAILNSPRELSAAFNPVTLNVLMIAMALVGLACFGRFPSAGRCLRTKVSESCP
jgi:hypothetical protein